MQDSVDYSLEDLVVSLKISHRFSPGFQLEQNENRRNRHQLYGNAMRFETLLPAELKEDVAWRTAMPKAYRWLIGSLCWRFCLRYDYDLAPEDGKPPTKKVSTDVPVS